MEQNDSLQDMTNKYTLDQQFLNKESLSKTSSLNKFLFGYSLSYVSPKLIVKWNLVKFYWHAQMAFGLWTPKPHFKMLINLQP